uniref:Uncharacterized protein n=2 Tax=Wuchereria bancrofti TaxID=6293 RepID=A0A1I8EN28_WUCBA
MSSEKSGDKNLYVTNNALGGQRKVNDKKVVDDEKNNNETTEGARLNSVCGTFVFPKSKVVMGKMQTNDSSASAMLLQSLADDDFRNLLNTAAKPQYGSLQRKRKKSQKTAEYGGRRLSDAGENNGLSAEADNLLAQFRREAELNQRNADIERKNLMKR